MQGELGKRDLAGSVQLGRITWENIGKSIEMVDFLKREAGLIYFELKQMSITSPGHHWPGQNPFKETLDCLN